MRRTLMTLTFSVVATNQGLFPVLHMQLKIRCAGDEREKYSMS